ncbi:MAG: TorF family putative porin, partial [Caldimonas sp.]
MKNPLILLPLLALTAAAARAEDPQPPPFTANIAVTSNYKYRGQDQGNNKPAVQGGFDWSQNGFYL